jgi:hypothetical protein
MGYVIKDGRSRVRFPTRSMKFPIVILSAALWLCGRLGLYKKWVPEMFLGQKATGVKG